MTVVTNIIHIIIVYRAILMSEINNCVNYGRFNLFHRHIYKYLGSS